MSLYITPATPSGDNSDSPVSSAIRFSLKNSGGEFVLSLAGVKVRSSMPLFSMGKEEGVEMLLASGSSTLLPTRESCDESSKPFFRWRLQSPQHKKVI